MVVPSLSQASHAFYRYWAAAVGSCMLVVGVPWGVQGAQVATGQREKYLYHDSIIWFSLVVNLDSCVDGRTTSRFMVRE